MDLSSLTEAQQQQLQQLHQQFQQHQLQRQQEQQAQQQQQQQQQQELASQAAYDSSQVQAYDQATQAYYQYHHYQQQHQQSHQSQEQQYPYYPSEYTNVYHQQQTQHQHQHQHQQQPSQPETVPAQPSGVSAQSEQSQMAVSAATPGQGQHQQNAYYSQGVGENQNPGYPVPSGLNPAAAAAVAALSQLTQFAGTMDAAERAMAGLQERQWHAKGGGYGPMPGPGPMHHMRPPVGWIPYGGGGRRGGGPFRGGGRGHFGHRHSRPDGSSSHFRGKGRGRGGGRRFASRGTAPSSHPASNTVEETAASTDEESGPATGIEGETPYDLGLAPSDQGPGQRLVSTSASGQAAPTKQPQIAWCELCRVDCTSLEILEQHKNGKRHKKNLQRFEQLQNANKPMTQIQNEQKVVPESIPKISMQAENVPGVEDSKQTLPENLPIEDVTDENKMETEQKTNLVEQSDVVRTEQTEATPRRSKVDRFDNRRRGMKRKMMRGGHGGKRMRISEGPRRQVEPPKPKEVIPLICDLCNVKCDTQAVFDCHLAGKKHLSKLKRFHGHQAMFGPVGLQALYPPHPNAQPTYFAPPVHHQPVYAPHGFFPRPATYMAPQAQQAAGVSEIQIQQAAAAGAGIQPYQVAASLNIQPQQAPAVGGSEIQAPQVTEAGSQIQAPEPAAAGSEIQAPQAAAAGSDIQVPQAEPAGSEIQVQEAEAAGTEIQAQQDAAADPEIQTQQDLETQGLEVAQEPGSQIAGTVEDDAQQKSATAEPVPHNSGAVDTKYENNGLQHDPPLENSIVEPSDNTNAVAKQVLPAAEEGPEEDPEEDPLVPEHGVASADNVALPGLDTKMDEPGSNILEVSD